MNKKKNLLVKTTRRDKRFSVSMALVATVAILAIGLFAAPHVYAESDSKRARDGFTDGSNAARDDLQNGNQFNLVCDPNGIHTSDGQHTTIYCNAWNEGYTSTWNQLYQPQSQQLPAQNVGPGGSGQQNNPNIILQCKML
jgi:hypothetical protein